MSNLTHDNALWNKTVGVDRVLAELRSGRAVVTATAVTRDGRDYRLLLAPDGRVLDTAEHGLLEARAAAGLAGPLPAFFETAPLGELTGDAADVYGGIAGLLLDRLEPASLPLWEACRESLAGGRPGLVVIRLGEGGRAFGHSLLLADGRHLGDPLPETVRAEAGRRAPDLAGLTLLEAEGGRYLLDPYRPLPPLYLLGAGLVCRLVAELAPLAGFRAVVVDADPEYANRQRFPTAAEVLVVPEFHECFAGRNVGEDASIVVATRGHAYDPTALAQALRTGAGYVGMMASKADGRGRMDRLRREGFGEADVARVHTPIGLPLGGKTPAVIAMSIMAEVAQCVNARRR